MIFNRVSNTCEPQEKISHKTKIIKKYYTKGGLNLNILNL